MTWNSILGEGSDSLPQYPIRYHLGLISGHLLDDHTTKESRQAIKQFFMPEFEKAKGFKIVNAGYRTPETIIMQGEPKTALRSNRISFWLELGMDVLQSTNLKEITLGLYGGHEITILANLKIVRSLWQLLVPMQANTVQPPEQQFRIFSEDKDEYYSPQWGAVVAFICYIPENEYMRKSLMVFHTNKLVYIKE